MQLGRNQYQQKSDVICTFTHNKSDAYLLNVEPNNLLFLKTYYKTEINHITKRLIDKKWQTVRKRRQS